MSPFSGIQHRPHEFNLAGFIDVGMSKGMSDEVTQNFIKQIPLGRLGEVSEIVNAILFLASPMASYITGHVLNVNGGYYMG